MTVTFNSDYTHNSTSVDMDIDLIYKEQSSIDYKLKLLDNQIASLQMEK